MGIMLGFITVTVNNCKVQHALHSLKHCCIVFVRNTVCGCCSKKLQTQRRNGGPNNNWLMQDHVGQLDVNEQDKRAETGKARFVLSL